MPSHKKRKTDRPPRGQVSASDMRAAVEEVISHGLPVNSVAKSCGIDRMTLKRYVRKVKAGTLTSFMPNYVSTQIFSNEQEAMLACYVLQSSKMHYGLSRKVAQKFAYDYAVANRVKVPNSWTVNQSASTDWLRAFMKRRSELSLRTPEATSFGRATAFNRHNIAEFFSNVHSVRSRYPYQA